MFVCLECGRKFKTARAAERAASDGCPGCGGVDIDLGNAPPAGACQQTGWVLRDPSGGFAVDDPIEGPIFTILLTHADVWRSEEEAVAAAKRRYPDKVVVAVKVWLDPKRDRATAVAIAK